MFPKWGTFWSSAPSERTRWQAAVAAVLLAMARKWNLPSNRFCKTGRLFATPPSYLKRTIHRTGTGRNRPSRTAYRKPWYASIQVLAGAHDSQRHVARKKRAADAKPNSTNGQLPFDGNDPMVRNDKMAD